LTSESSFSDIADLTFEDALSELESVVLRLERGDIPLKESVSVYERGMRLKLHCSKLLAEAEERVQKIQLDAESIPGIDKVSDD